MIRYCARCEKPKAQFSKIIPMCMDCIKELGYKEEVIQTHVEGGKDETLWGLYKGLFNIDGGEE